MKIIKNSMEMLAAAKLASDPKFATSEEVMEAAKKVDSRKYALVKPEPAEKPIEVMELQLPVTPAAPPKPKEKDEAALSQVLLDIQAQTNEPEEPEKVPF